MFRNNMWVVTDDGVGVLFKLGTYVSEIHLVDEADGTTKLIVTKGTNTLRQARYQEIPECRRGASKEWFTSKGYN
jgi:hypothetical protein